MPERIKSNIRKPIAKLSKLLGREQTQIVSTAVWLMIPSVLTKLTGQIYNLVAASFFGTANAGFNHFIIANTIPELLTTTLMVGAVGAVIIPILTQCKKEDGEQTFYRTYSSIINIATITFVLLSLILIIFGNVLLPTFLDVFIKPVDPISEGDLGRIVNMMRVLLIPQLILGVSVFISSGLNIYNRFIVPQLSGLFFNIGRLFAMFIFVPLMDYSPWALVLGVIIGAILHLLIQLPLFRSIGIHYYPIIELKSKYVREIAKVGIPRMFALASDQIAFAFNKFLASAFTGVSALTYATSLYLVVPSLFGYTFSYASYPALSRLFIDKNYKKIRSIIQKTLNEIIFLAMPFVVSIMVLRVPIVRVTYGIVPGTNFSLQDSFLVAWILLGFSLGLLFITARWFVLSLYYASKDTLTPLIVTAFSLFGVIGLSYALTNFFSYIPANNLAVIEVPKRILANAREFSISFGQNVDLLHPITFIFEIIGKGSNGLLKGFIVLILFSIVIYSLYKTYSLSTKKWQTRLITTGITVFLSLYVLLTSGLITIGGFSDFVIRSDSPAAVAGISTAMSIVYTIEFFVLLAIFNKTKVRIGYRRFIKRITPKFAAGAIMFLVIYAIFKIWSSFSYAASNGNPLSLSGSTSLNFLILLGVTVVPGFMVYYLICHFLQVEELAIMRKYLNPIFKLGGLKIREPRREE